jgi:hypothetical protein
VSSFICVEFSPLQGLDADNRPLLRSGDFGVGGQFTESDVATFASIAGAQAAAQRAKNRRVGTTIEVIGQRQRTTVAA